MQHILWPLVSMFYVRSFFQMSGIPCCLLIAENGGLQSCLEALRVSMRLANLELQRTVMWVGHLLRTHYCQHFQFFPPRRLDSCENSSPTSCLGETWLPVCPHLPGQGSWVPTGRHPFARAHLILWCWLPYPCTQPHLVVLISETSHLPSPNTHL